VPDGVPIVRVNNLVHGRIETKDAMRVAPEIDYAHRRTRLQGGELVLSLVGTTGNVAIVPSELAGWNVARAIAVIRPAKEVGAAWLKLCLESSHSREYLDARANTTVQKTLNLKDVRLLPIPLPPPRWRQEILSLVSPIERAVANLEGQNQSLEAIARAIFKSWFVDFDPVRAKAEGRDPEGMDADTAALFPSEFEDAELGSIPVGWKVMPIGELAEVMGGSTPSTKEPDYWDRGEHAWATPKDLSSLSMPILLSTDRKITSQGLTQISSGLLEPGTVLLSSRAPIGYLAIAEIPTAINQGFIAMKPKNGVSNLFLLFWTKTSHEAIISRANGSTFLEISKSAFRPIPVAAPGQEIMASFDGVVRPLYEAMVNNEKQSRTLSDLRDTLLPRLISGKLRVPEAERLIEAVV
jgi:type I restriction enzyme S subunit